HPAMGEIERRARIVRHELYGPIFVEGEDERRVLRTLRIRLTGPDARAPGRGRRPTRRRASEVVATLGSSRGPVCLRARRRRVFTNGARRSRCGGAVLGLLRRGGCGTRRVGRAPAHPLVAGRVAGLVITVRRARRFGRGLLTLRATSTR